MSENDPLHEAKQTVSTVQREFTAVGSLNTSAAAVALNTCEQAVCALYKIATGADFPYQTLTRHKPGKWIKTLGISNFYSRDIQSFMSRLDSFSLDRGRFEAEPAFQQHTSPTADGRSAEIVNGTLGFVSESERLLGNPAVLDTLRKSAIKKL